MAALNQGRQTPELDDYGKFIVAPVEAATIIYVGSLVALNKNGRAVPAQVYGATPLDVLRIVGRMDSVHNGIPGDSARNVVGASCPPAADTVLGAAGAISIVINRRGVFFYDINGSSIAAKDIDALCFAVDDHTVDLSDGGATRPCAGRIVMLDPAYPGMVAVDTADKAVTATAAGA